jgi:hypothetical protein
MWPFGRSRKRADALRAAEAERKAQEDLRIAFEVKWAAEREAKRIEEAAARCAAEAKEHARLGRHRTVISLKNGYFLVLRGIELTKRSIMSVASRWDATSTLQLVIPMASMYFAVSDEVSDKPPETSIEYRTTLPEGMLPRA